MKKPTSFRRQPALLLTIRRKLNVPTSTIMKKVIKMFILLLFLLFCYVFLNQSMPRAWQGADVRHIFRTISDFQDFRVEQMRGDSARRMILQNLFRTGPENYGSRMQHKMFINATQGLKQFPQESSEEYYPEFFQELELLEALSVKNLTALKRLQMLQSFRPILTPQEKSKLLKAFDVFTSVCDAAGVTYFLLEASLMGVRRHHGMIPWDDDIDIVVNASQWMELYAVLSYVPGFELFAPNDVQWKFYINSSHQFSDKPFKFPYLDIFFFNEDEDFIWAVTMGLKHDLIHKKSDIFPLVLRPFEGRLVKVPNNLALLVDESHDVSDCVTGEYNHKTNTRFRFHGKVSVPCSHLRPVYPFVDRELDEHGFEVETLRLGSKLLGHIKLLNNEMA